MKAILVIDMPKNCHDCPCYHEGYGRCTITAKFIEEVGIVDSWCPLKPMPQKAEYEGDRGIDIVGKVWTEGWNACLKEIENG